MHVAVTTDVAVATDVAESNTHEYTFVRPHIISFLFRINVSALIPSTAVVLLRKTI